MSCLSSHPVMFQFNPSDILPTLGLVSLVVYVVFVRIFPGVRPTRLKGPGSNAFIINLHRYLSVSDSGVVCEKWVQEYGSVYQLPLVLGGHKIIVADPKAVAHFFSLDTYGYTQTPGSKRFLDRVIGRGLFYAEADSHRR